jgi:hypothetical protein
LNLLDLISSLGDATEIIKLQKTETRKYVAVQNSSANDNGDPLDRFFITTETSRLVSHLTNVMSWILWHKAANLGEISTAKAQSMGEKHLATKNFSPRQNAFQVDLPQILESLIGRTELLHNRVSRLSQMVH